MIRTLGEFGYVHYYKCHDMVVDRKHMNSCDLIRPAQGNVTDIIKPLSNVTSICNLDP